jgi:hypothetical protein
MTDGQSASLSWNKAPIWDLRPDFYYCQRQLRVCWCGRPSLTRGLVCRLQLVLALTRTVIFGSESLGTRDDILLSRIRDFPFRRLLRLAGLRWRYSTPPPHGSLTNNYQSESELLYDWRFFWRQVPWDPRPVILFTKWTLAVIVPM